MILPSDLSWIPIFPEVHLSRTVGFRYDQTAWYWRLWLAMIRAEKPGYIAMQDVRRVAGGRDGEPCLRSWDKHGPAVLTQFQRATFAGVEYLYDPQLVEILCEQQKKIHKKPRSSTVSTSSGGLSSHLISEIEVKKTSGANSVGEPGNNLAREIDELRRRVRNQGKRQA